MDVLYAALEEAANGRGQLVMLMGEAGIGKTRTAKELADHAQKNQTHVVWGWCYEGEGAPSYWPWVDSLRTYIRGIEPGRLRKLLGSGAAPITDMIPDVLGILDDIEPAPSMEPDQARFRLFDAITGFLKKASEDSPILLVLDDLHWADQPSLLLLEFLARQIENSRIMIIGTYRDAEAPPESLLGDSLGRLTRLSSFHRQPIAGMPPEFVRQYVMGETGVAPSTAMLEAIHAHTEGNPFFLSEVVRNLAELGRLVETSDAPSGSVDLGTTPGIRDVVNQRLTRLSDPCNQAMSTASIIGREFELELLNSLDDLSGTESLLDVMDEAISARIVEEVPGPVVKYQFRHALMQQTLAENLSAGRKVRLHARIGEALEIAYGDNPGDHTAQLAHHFTQAAPVLGYDKMLHYTLLAGERALSSYAHEEAVGHFMRGLEAKGIDPLGQLPAGDADTAGFLYGMARAKLGLFSFRAGYVQEAVANLRSAFEYHMRAGDVDQAVGIALTPLRTLVGERGGLADVVKQALEIATPGSSAKGQLLAIHGWLAGLEEGDYPAAELSFQEALEIARENGDVLLLQRTLAQAAQVDLYSMRFNESIEKAGQVLSMADTSLDINAECAARYAYCVCRLWIGEPVARQELLNLLSVAETFGNRFWLHMAIWISEIKAGLDGDWETARQYGERGLALAPGAPTLLSTMPHTALETGQFEQAELMHRQLSVLLSENPSNPTYQYPAAVVAAGMSSWFTGSAKGLAFSPKFAEVVLSSEFTPKIYAAVTEIGLAFEALAKNDLEACQQAYDSLLTWKGRFLVVASTDRLLGQLALTLGSVPQAIGHFEDSLRFCDSAGYRPEYAWTCWGYAAALLQIDHEGDPSRTGRLLADALQITVDLDMPPLRSRVELLISRMGDSSTPAYPDGLTQREVEVLQLICGGKTDREIAEELFISYRTVGNHVRSILNKSGTANRTEAASYANQHDLVARNDTTE